MTVQIVEIPDMAIVMADGTRLSARVWMPEDAASNPVPVVLEYLPYRKRDGTAARDQLTHPWMAAQGYACVRVDQRGNGESEGLFDDEYSAQEMSDGLEVIAWLAEQPWSTGKVGMMGISWGGFNCLQAAYNKAPALKAVISLCSTTDRYADDIHYKGGCLISENISWAATAASWFSVPPDPELVGDKWRDIWLNRLEEAPFLARTWHEHSQRDAYWKHGSVCEDYDAISAAVYSIGGWHDGYRNTPAHLAANVKAPVRAVVGPWNHKYPHFAVPGPRIGFLQEAVRWWDHWLKGIDNGADKDPQYTAWLMDSVKPETSFTHRPGRWITEAVWPSPSIANRRMALGFETLGAEAAGAFSQKAVPSTAVGMGTGEYFPFGFGPGELPDDQRADDALSACFDSAETSEITDIVGAPRVTLRLASDQARGQIIVRLNDLRPDGTSAMISYGMLNLRHRNSHEVAEPLVPGEVYEVSLDLDQIAYRLPAGHRLRIAVSTSYWPLVWPEAVPVTATISGGWLDLPVRPTAQGDETSFPEPVTAPALPKKEHSEGEEFKRIETDMTTGVTKITTYGAGALTEDLTHGVRTSEAVEKVYAIHKDDPASARVDITWNRTYGRGDWQVRTRVVTSMWGDADHLHIEQHTEAWEGDTSVFQSSHKDSVPRG
ncbi:CocE/NonD family hydrolase [Xinfangfangia sp. CPCC 101601]|uniref:CocE/NonD family hydrolase n=1 Tax=Pseudogemmobacter lacusdianii TaxID=3069608 RepID=A0ABU0VYC2_9RHOB|nr:CocE/NonD family hydrolase [Xinfangfangia sp. CPCC 101601]MDQ2065895.1 CocE/NonD family hydrolase [Xinfangfangia sp. CPCC 101601]